MFKRLFLILLFPSACFASGNILITGSTGSGSGTVTSVGSGTGLTGGPITTSGTLAIANTAVTPGSYTNSNITVDQQGRITSAASGTGGGGGGASALEVFNNFNGARSSPTASIGMSNAFAGSVSGSTFTFALNSSSVTLQGVITAGSNITLTPGAGTLTIASTGGGGSSIVDTGLIRGRLTTETGVPVSFSSRTAQGTIYFTPYKGNVVSLYNGTAFFVSTFSEISLALVTTAGKNYDVFLSSTLALKLSNPWTSDTVRADSLSLLQGVYVAASTNTLRYMGTIRSSGTNTTEDSFDKRFVWNYYNRQERKLLHTDTTDNWTYAGTWRQANSSTTNQVEVVVGVQETQVTTYINQIISNPTSTNYGVVAIGINSTTVNSADVTELESHDVPGTTFHHSESTLRDYPVPGYTKYIWLEECNNTGASCGFFGDDGGGNRRAGLTGYLEN